MADFSFEISDTTKTANSLLWHGVVRAENANAARDGIEYLVVRKLSRETGLFYWYSYGHKSQLHAALALEHAFATGDLLPGERPEIRAYQAQQSGKRRYGIAVPLGMAQ